MFSTYLELGITHILDVKGYDHILFIVVLCALYTFKDWKKVIILATAFTIGHSLTLALSALEIVVFPADIIEFLIPLTIFLTGLYNIIKPNASTENLIASYSMAAFFGLIHGLGFSNYFKALLGKEENIIEPLLAFNIGVELGQIVIILVTLGLCYLLVDVFSLKRKYWKIGVSLSAMVIAIYLMF